MAPMDLVLWQQACLATHVKPLTWQFFAQDTAPPGWEVKYPRNKAYKARIIYVDPGSKTVRLSFRPHVVAWTSATLPPIGSLVEVTSFSTSILDEHEVQPTTDWSPLLLSVISRC